MTKEELTIIHKIDNEILFDVDRVCNANGIEYCLMFGTLLGAVRHKGPIPWDDDVDIGMTRENYNRFLEVAFDELEPVNEVHIMGSGSTKYISEIKIGRKGTRYCLAGTENLNIMKQIHLDVFLIDRIKEGRQNNRFLNRIRKLLETIKLNWDEKRLILKCIERSNRKGKLFFKAGLLFMHFIRMILGEELLEKILFDIYVDKKNNSKTVGIVTGVERVRTWPEDFKTIKMEYAGKMLPVPDCYDLILTDSYGDYMEFPPERNRYRSTFDDWILDIDEEQSRK